VSKFEDIGHRESMAYRECFSLSESIVIGIVDIDSYETSGLGSNGVWIYWL
jgi:hypothetical protein